LPDARKIIETVHFSCLTPAKTADIARVEGEALVEDQKIRTTAIPAL
jgi:hypothetical protein